MKLQEVGGRRQEETELLSHDWFERLTLPQLEAYIRYLFIYMREGVKDWDSPAHSKPRVHWDGGTDSKGCKYKSVWNLIARRIKSHNANPGMWVAAHFSPAVAAVRLSQGKGLITNRPELLNGTQSLEIYNNYVLNFNETFVDRFASAEASIDTRFKILENLGLPRDDRFFLTICDSSHVNAPPFLRHAFSAAMDCRRGVFKFAVQAAIDYEMQQPMYDELIADHDEFNWLLTDNIRKVVIWLRQHWRQYRG
jgi:hypothetical protein